jgi:hypothetical protein
MRDDEKLEITAGRIRKLAEYYSGFKLSFPEVFKEEERWETLKDPKLVPGIDDVGGFYVGVFDNSVQIATIWSDGYVSMWQPYFRNVSSKNLFKFERKVSPCPK